MNRIEEIKDNVKHMSELVFDNEPRFTLADMKYLLSLIEKSEKYFNKMISGDVWMTFDEDPVDAYKELAKHALNQLRGG